MKKEKSKMDGTEQVNEFVDKLDHPFKAEVEMIREIIKNVSKGIAEQIKWNAPSFSYKGETLVTFNLWEKKRIHLVFHNSMISKVKSNYWKEIITTAGWRILPIRTRSRQKGKTLKRH
jgi:uncharacterized protein YdhG (YjbR/CyaY superfamily)